MEIYCTIYINGQNILLILETSASAMPSGGAGSNGNAASSNIGI